LQLLPQYGRACFSRMRCCLRPRPYLHHFSLESGRHDYMSAGKARPIS